MKQKIIFIFLMMGCALFIFQPGVMAASGITANVPSLNFGDQAEGTISASQDVTLTNVSNGDGIIGAIVLAGQDPGQFLILEDFCSGTVLANQTSCVLSVAYGPTLEIPHGVGPAQADLQITFQTSGPISIALSGNSLVPNISSNVTAMDFGKKVAGQLSDPQTLIITNTGQADLIFGSARPSDGDTVDFAPSLDLCSFQSLAPGESCNIDINMRATDQGDRMAKFTIESNDPDQPLFSIDLTGVGTGSGGCSLSGWDTHPLGIGIWFLLLVFPLMRWGKRPVRNLQN
jgi:hypothetical protein